MDANVEKEIKKLCDDSLNYALEEYRQALESPEDDDHLSYSEGRLSEHIRSLFRMVAGHSLHSIQSASEEIMEKLHVSFATSEADALNLPNGSRAFSVSKPDDSYFGIATISPTGKRYVTLITKEEKDGERDLVTVSEWRPRLPGDISGLGIEGLGLTDHTLSQDIIRAAMKLREYSVAGDDYDLATIKSKFVNGGENEYFLRLSSSKPRSAGRIFGNLRNQDEAPVLWGDYADSIRDLYRAAYPSLERVDDGFYMRSDADVDILVDRVIELDGGFAGEHCAYAIRCLNEKVLEIRTEQDVKVMVELAQEMLKCGVGWGENEMTYFDLDRITFSVAGPDGSLGRYHRNVDLMSDWDNHFSVIRRNAEGTPITLELHRAHRPAGRIKEWDPQDKAIDLAISAAHHAEFYADPEASPPRLTRRDLAERLASGQPMPPPVAGVDLVTMKPLPGSLEVDPLIFHHLYMGIDTDLLGLKSLKAGDFVQLTGDFTEDGEHEDLGVENSVDAKIPGAGL